MVKTNIAEKRKAVFEALDYFNWVKTRRSVIKLDDTTINPGKTYIKEQERYVQGKVIKIRTAAKHKKSKLVWDTVNEFKEQ